MSQMPKLISFTICPFAQRTRVLLNVKKIDHSIEYIDLENKPKWFLDRVPTAKVPALFVGEETLFESAIINEYLDDVSLGSLLPNDPLERAKTRAWIVLADDLIFRQFRLMMAKNAAGFEQETASLITGLAQFSDVALSRAKADDVNLVDAALVPVFTRLVELPSLYRKVTSALKDIPQIQTWCERLLAAPAVKGSLVADFSTDFAAHFRHRDSHALSLETEGHHA